MLPKHHIELGMVVHTFNPSSQKAEAGRSLSLRPDWSSLQSQFQDSQGFTENPCLKKKNNKRKQHILPHEYVQLLYIHLQNSWKSKSPTYFIQMSSERNHPLSLITSVEQKEPPAVLAGEKSKMCSYRLVKERIWWDNLS
jgi:hypothetical protein